MVRQLSQTPCVQGRSWGTRGNQVWVDKGCRAEFAIGGPGYGGPSYGGRPPYGGDYHGGPPRGGPPAYYAGSFSGGRSNCTSGRGAGPVYCQSGGAFKYANPIRVNSACVQNRTWGVSQYGLWVANGCSGQWEIKKVIQSYSLESKNGEWHIAKCVARRCALRAHNCGVL